MGKMKEGKVEHPDIPGQTSLLTYLEMLDLTESGYAHRSDPEFRPAHVPSALLGNSVEIHPVSEKPTSNTGD